MENNTITIHLHKENDVILDTNNPDINSLVKAIVSSKDNIEINKITVTSEIDDFDSAGFTDLIKKMVSKYLDAIKLENDIFRQFETQIKESES